MAVPIRHDPPRIATDGSATPEGATHKDASLSCRCTAKRKGARLHRIWRISTPQDAKQVGACHSMPTGLSRHYLKRTSGGSGARVIFRQVCAQVREALLPTRRVVSLEADGGRVRIQWRLYDGAQVESVLMRYPQRTTLCVSSQAGCGMACPFCAGQMGLTVCRGRDRRSRFATRAGRVPRRRAGG